jgi:hypothetical protein
METAKEITSKVRENQRISARDRPGNSGGGGKSHQ